MSLLRGVLATVVEYYPKKWLIDYRETIKTATAIEQEKII